MVQEVINPYRDPAAKAAYDARLRAESGAPAFPAIPSSPQSVRARLSTIRAHWASVRQTLFRMFIVMISVAAVVVAAAFYYHARQRQVAENEAEKAPRSERARQRGGSTISADALEPVSDSPTEGKVARTQRDPAAKAIPHVQALAQSNDAGSPAAKRAADNSLAALAAAEVKKREEDASSESPAEEKPKAAATARDRPAQVDPQKQDLYKRTVAAARTAMSRRDMLGGKRNTKAAAKLAQTPEEEAEAARLDTLAQHLDEFWKTMTKVIVGLTPAQEFTLGNTPIIVVETSPTRITFRAEGRNQSFTIKDLPRPIVEALVQGGFTDNAATKLIFGAYLAMDARGDRQTARKLWQELIDAGSDVSDLMAELDLAPAGKAPPTPAAGKPEKTEVARTAPPADPAALRQAEQAVRARFEVDYNLASSVSGKLKLSEKLATAAASADVPEENRFVMLRDARDFALAAGKPAIACEVIDRLMQQFTVDALELKTAAMEQAAKMVRTTSGSKEAAECALTLVAQAIQARRWDEAGRLATVAVSTAQRARNAALVHSAREAKLKVDEASEKADAGEKKSQK